MEVLITRVNWTLKFLKISAYQKKLDYMYTAIHTSDKECFQNKQEIANAKRQLKNLKA